jgi:NAD-dependent deacetylase
VFEFFNAARQALTEAQPNEAHKLIAEMEQHFDVTVVTQNVDDLHERAGSRRTLHMHGEHLKAWCTGCGRRSEWNAPLNDRPPCPVCGERALRPDVVWFG